MHHVAVIEEPVKEPHCERLLFQIDVLELCEYKLPFRYLFDLHVSLLGEVDEHGYHVFFVQHAINDKPDLCRRYALWRVELHSLDDRLPSAESRPKAAKDEREKSRQPGRCCLCTLIILDADPVSLRKSGQNRNADALIQVFLMDPDVSSAADQFPGGHGVIGLGSVLADVNSDPVFLDCFWHFNIDVGGFDRRLPVGRQHIDVHVVARIIPVIPESYFVPILELMIAEDITVAGPHLQDVVVVLFVSVQRICGAPAGIYSFADTVEGHRDITIDPVAFRVENRSHSFCKIVAVVLVDLDIYVEIFRYSGRNCSVVFCKSRRRHCQCQRQRSRENQPEKQCRKSASETNHFANPLCHFV